MPNHFGKSFNNIENEHLLVDLKTLENQGCVYEPFPDGSGGIDLCRVDLTPGEIYRFVEAMYAYEEFSGFLLQDFPPEEALEKISSNKIRERVEDYNEWAEERDIPDQKYCPAAFYGQELESLLTGNRTDRYEVIPHSKLMPIIEDG